MSEPTWREALKVGDEVIVVRGYGRDRSVHKVTHATPKFVDALGYRFRRKDGAEYGPANQWSRAQIEEATSEAVALVRHQMAVAAARSALASAHWHSMPESVVLATHEAYRAAVSRTEGEAEK